ncbi:MAG: response regulator [Myxococcales bacterium]|nr:response regulator [Myxococcales bacterium]MCB9705431.1 response regulator [Myxococcales bacterium]
MSMKILVADDDPISATVLEALLTATGNECQIAHDGSTAWEIAQGADPPRIMFLDWMMPGIDGLELCRQVRALPRSFYTYIVIVSARNRQRDITLGFEAGADDFITKPYQAEEVLARLRVAERVVRSLSTETSLDRALAEARGAAGGDVIVRSGGVVGRIMFQGGKVAWASISSEPGSLKAMLETEPLLDGEDIKTILEESAASGTNVAQVILDWKLLTPERLHRRMRTWISAKITAIANLPAPSVIFSPDNRPYDDAILFDFEEVSPLLLIRQSPVEDAPSEIPANEPNAVFADGESLRELGASLDEAMTIEGAIAVALFDGRTGQCLGTRGEDVDLDLAWRKVKLAAAANSWDEIDDIIITTRHHIYFLRPYTRSPPRFIFLATDRTQAKMGMVRLALAACSRG